MRPRVRWLVSFGGIVNEQLTGGLSHPGYLASAIVWTCGLLYRRYQVKKILVHCWIGYILVPTAFQGKQASTSWREVWSSTRRSHRSLQRSSWDLVGQKQHPLVSLVLKNQCGKNLGAAGESNRRAAVAHLSSNPKDILDGITRDVIRTDFMVGEPRFSTDWYSWSDQ